MSTATNMTLLNIEMELLGLLQFREDISRDPDVKPSDLVESLKAVDAQIEDYVNRELDKADGIAANLREFAIRAATCKTEAKRAMDRAAMWQERVEHLEAATVRALQLRPKAQQRIETANTTIKLAKNPASVQIVDASEIPKPYMRRQLTLNADLYDRMMGYLMTMAGGAPIFQELQAAKTTEPEPMKTDIGKELKAGVAVPGAKLIDDRVRLVIE